MKYEKSASISLFACSSSPLCASVRGKYHFPLIIYIYIYFFFLITDCLVVCGDQIKLDGSASFRQLLSKKIAILLSQPKDQGMFFSQLR